MFSCIDAISDDIQVCISWLLRNRSRSEMELTPVIYEVSSRLSDETLEVLSRTSLWPSIMDAAQNQLWWYARCEWLVERQLAWENGNWANVYTSLVRVKDRPRFAEDLDYSNPLLVSVLLDLGANPSSLVRTTLANTNGGQGVIQHTIVFVVRDGNIDSVSRALSSPKITASDISAAADEAIWRDRKDILDLLISHSRTSERMKNRFLRSYRDATSQRDIT